MRFDGRQLDGVRLEDMSMEQFIERSNERSRVLTITKQEFRALELWERSHTRANLDSDFVVDLTYVRAVFDGGTGVLAVTLDRDAYTPDFLRVVDFLAIS
jgi:hypothetical protein